MKAERNCHCGANATFENCCQPIINGTTIAKSAETLMRSRYSAYVVADADYLIATTHPSTRKFHPKNDILKWAKQTHWLKLAIITSTETTVEFKAYYLNESLQSNIHHELSNFVCEYNNWFYVDGTMW